MRRLLLFLIVIALCGIACKLGGNVPEVVVSPEPEATFSLQTAIETEYEHGTLIIPYNRELSGSVNEAGGVQLGFLYPGDNRADNADFEAFMTFDLASIPESSVITQAGIWFEWCEVNGFPFSDTEHGLGSLHVQTLDYGDTLDVEDYLGNATGVLVRDLDEQWARECPNVPIDVEVALRQVLETGNRLQLRLFFDDSNNDNARDDIVFENPVLIVEYMKERGEN